VTKALHVAFLLDAAPLEDKLLLASADSPAVARLPVCAVGAILMAGSEMGIGIGIEAVGVFP
jgi:hypothetical protein